MALILRNHELRGLMTVPEYIAAVEDGYREVGLGRGAPFPRENLWIEGEADASVRGGHLRAGSKASFKFKAALLPGMGGAGMQAYTAGLGRGLETFLFLFDTESGALSAILEVLYYDWLKTAAVGAVAADRLAPAGSRTVALFGTGRHARSQLHGLREVRPIARVQAYSREPEAREAFCRRMTDELGLEVVAAASPAEALAGADIVTTITNAPTPVFDGALLPEGPLHINAMGAHYPWVREIDEATVAKSRVFVDERRQGLSEQGEILMPMAEGRLDASHVVGDLGELVARRVEGREAATGWTLFLSGGTGIEDVAVATRLVERAREAGVGTEVAFNLPYEFEI